ncbi:MAG: SufD family Fe-S cluster assembly protein [Rikenellaceae bacterium]
MDSFLRDIESLNFTPVEECVQLSSGVRIVEGCVLLNGSGDSHSIRVKRSDDEVKIVYLHSVGGEELSVEVERGAKLSVVEVVSEGVESKIRFSQQSDSQLHVTALQLGESELDYTLDLDGEGCDCRVEQLQLTTNSDRALSRVRVNHNRANCTSSTQSRAIAGGESECNFWGLIYVAKDSQRTEAYQNSRNVALTPTAKIVAEPQLEIYADDVKCSHGATIGEMNHDAIFYMRQRGLSEAQARKVQLEGFAGQLAQECGVEQMSEALMGLISDRLTHL